MNGFFRAIVQRRQDDSHEFTRLSGVLHGLKSLRAARRRVENTAEHFRAILDFVGVSPFLIEKIYF